MRRRKITLFAVMALAVSSSPGCLLGWGSADTAPPGDSGSYDTGCASHGCARYAEAIAEFPANNTFAFAFTDGAAYVASRSTTPSESEIIEVPLPDGPGRSLLSTPLMPGGDLVYGDGRLYYQTHETVLVDTVFVDVYQLRSFTLPAGPEVVLSDVGGNDLHFHDGYIYFFPGTGYFPDAGPNAWARLPADGSAPVSAFDVDGWGLAFDADTVYFTRTAGAGAAVARAPVADPSTVTELALVPEGSVHDIKIDGSSLYFCTTNLYRIPGDALSTATPQLLHGTPYVCGTYLPAGSILFTGTPDFLSAWSVPDGSKIPMAFLSGVDPIHADEAWVYSVRTYIGPYVLYRMPLPASL